MVRDYIYILSIFQILLPSIYAYCEPILQIVYNIVKKKENRFY